MSEADALASAFSMPLMSPSYPRGPYRFTDREHLIITYRTDEALLRHAIPEPLGFEAPIVRCEFMTMTSSTGFGRYSGAAQHIPVRFAGELGAYTHTMMLDAHAPISGGRELWGFPQKLGAPQLGVVHDTLIGVLNYGAERVATATMGYKHHALDEAAAMAMLNEPGYLLKIIPHVDGSARICELVRYRRQEIVLKGAWTGPAALDFSPHAQAPFSSLPVLEIVSGIHLIADFTLAMGEIVHDYLA